MSDNAARVLSEQGTPGPWRVAPGRSGCNWIEAGNYDEVLVSAPVDCMAYCYGGSSRITLEDVDAAKIVAAVNALPLVADLLDAQDAFDEACDTTTMENIGMPEWFEQVDAAKTRRDAARDALDAALRGEG